MRSLLSLAVSLLGLVVLSVAKSSTGDSVLVVLEPQLDRKDYSTFFDGLEAQGYSLTFRSPKDEKPVIIKDGYAAFDHVILFSPTSKAYASDITPQSLVDLLSLGSNLLLAVSPTQTPLSSLAPEFGLGLPPPNTPLISHFPARSPPFTTLPISVPSTGKNGNGILSPNTAPVWFAGVPHTIGNNPYLVPILHAPPESFAADTDSDAGAEVLVEAAEKGGEGLWAGSALGVVSGFQARSGARVAWVGGVEVFSDAFINKEVSKGVKSGNAQFIKDLAAWTFQESLVLRIDSTSHHRVNETEAPEMYTIKDQIVYTAHISKFDSAKSAWVPYSGITDMQLEFTMLDPHIRTALLPVAGSPGEYSVTFTAPDRHGVFKFVLDYKRKGWSHLLSTTVVPVVPPRHDGYPRFLSAAWPYYTGAISTSVAFVLFSALWLAGDDKDMSLKPNQRKKLQ